MAGSFRDNGLGGLKTLQSVDSDSARGTSCCYLPAIGWTQKILEGCTSHSVLFFRAETSFQDLFADQPGAAAEQRRGRNGGTDASREEGRVRSERLRGAMGGLEEGRVRSG